MDKNGDTAFLFACWKAEFETVKLLVELGADINKTDQCGRNGLMIAARFRRNNIIKYLNDKNNQLINAEDENGETALTIAREGCLIWEVDDTVKLLLELGADINKTDQYDRNVLRFAQTNW